MANQEIAIKAENLSKRFLVSGGLKEHNLMSIFSKRRAYRGMDDAERTVDGNFWALRDINMNVYRGETLGIIGANGAGKTTLLKVFSKILKQSHGTYTVNGRVSSLIGVGTGFHQELTGRENVYFNGALLGMKKKEINRRFEEIVDFSEVGSFIDSPLKFYSSGMRSRLAFSVAMNLDAEIMIIDEALAVGDVAFREKSTEKMRNTAFTGRTVLFVTHSMSFMQEVCDRSILLERGRMIAEGRTENVVDTYLSRSPSSVKLSWKAKDKKIGDDTIEIESLNLIVDGKINKAKSFSDNKKVEVAIKLHSKSQTNLYSVGYSLFDDANRKLWSSCDNNLKLGKGTSTMISQLPTKILRPGEYFLAMDVEKRSEGWIVDPHKTSAKITFNLFTGRKDVLTLRQEGLIKPQTSWNIQ